ncbi:MAG: aminotransferase class V-fold PLP-dependent enzyme [Candidatus Obscuribacterales bacterium]|nr:aminotransferase class V-fold PLP-dependent enzyme [Candidatus Obscuribacterales bacterium]
MGVSQDQSKTSLAEFRSQFIALQNKHYLNFGAQGVISERTLQAMMESYHFVQENGPLNNTMFEWIVNQAKQLKETIASNFGGEAGSYAITQNATEGCNIALWGVDWKEGDRLLLTDSEHNGVVAAAKQLSKRRGVILDYCDLSKLQSDEQILKELEQSLKSKPRMFLFSHVLWNTGAVLPAKQIASLCRQSSCISVIDGAQSAGVLPIDVADIGADAYAITGHKWMGGPEGVGSLHVREEALDFIQPTFVGWRSTVYDGSENPPFLKGAARFEIATSPFPLMSGLDQALQIHSSYASAEERYQRIVRIARALRAEIESLPGVKFLSERQDSSLVSFTLENRSPGQIVKALEENFKVTVRTIPFPSCIRASVHYFSEDEAREFASALAAVLK